MCLVNLNGRHGVPPTAWGCVVLGWETGNETTIPVANPCKLRQAASLCHSLCGFLTCQWPLSGARRLRRQAKKPRLSVPGNASKMGRAGGASRKLGLCPPFDNDICQSLAEKQVLVMFLAIADSGQGLSTISLVCGLHHSTGHLKHWGGGWRYRTV